MRENLKTLEGCAHPIVTQNLNPEKINEFF
jgi:hypothetical protein